MKLKKFKSLFKLSGKFQNNLAKIKLLFIFIFLNIWDFLISKELFNGMALGVILFGPAVLLWYVGNIRSAALTTLISLFEFMVMLVFILQGFELGGIGTSLKSIYWLPYLMMAGINGFWGLKIYSEHREKRQKSS